MTRNRKTLLLFLDVDWHNPQTGGELVNAEVIQFALKYETNVDLFTGEHLPRIVRQQKVLSRICINIICAFFCIFRRYDLIVTDQYLHSKIVLASIIARIRGTKQVAIVYHLTYSLRKNRMLRWAEKMTECTLLSSANLIITLSESAEREVQDLGISGQKIRRIIPPVNSLGEREEFVRPVHHGGLKLLFVGTCYERKGIKYLLEALSLLNEEVDTLHIVGKYEEQDIYYIELQSIIAQHHLGNRVYFHGRISDSDLKQFYRSADVFVLPSLWEGFGFVLQEAMIVGLPIIATNVGSIPELIVDNENGILVPARDSNALAQAISYLYAHPEQRIALGQVGYNKILAADSQGSFAQQLFDLANSLYEK